MGTARRQSISRSLAGVASALPDALTAGFFLVVWLWPLRFGTDAVKTAILIMIVEFLTVHASGLLGGVVLSPGRSRGTRLKVLAGVGVVYLLFVIVFVLIFQQWWPLLVFGWLLLAKFSRVLSGTVAATGDAAIQIALWVASGIFYLLGVLLTVLLPLPRLGVTAAVVSGLDLPGSGIWVEEPHRLLAFGFLYFAALAAVKLRLGSPSR